jgi:hypothetical protein
MNPLPEPTYITSFEEVFWGGTLVAVTMALHGLGMILVLRAVAIFRFRLEARPSFLKGMFSLILASWLILGVHLLEVFSWAMFFLRTQAVNSSSCTGSLCYYVALMDYTTLGCNYNLILRWRLLEGVIAVAGLLTFAWSTGVLLTLAQEFQEQQLQLLKQWREKRHTRQ